MTIPECNCDRAGVLYRCIYQTAVGTVTGITMKKNNHSYLASHNSYLHSDAFRPLYNLYVEDLGKAHKEILAHWSGITVTFNEENTLNTFNISQSMKKIY